MGRKITEKGDRVVSGKLISEKVAESRGKKKRTPRPQAEIIQTTVTDTIEELKLVRIRSSSIIFGYESWKSGNRGPITSCGDGNQFG